MGEHLVVESCVRGFHEYQHVRSPEMGERLECVREPLNTKDAYAVAMTKNDVVVGHVPHNISTPCSIFLRKGGSIHSIVNGTCHYSGGLPQVVWKSLAFFL